MFKQVALLFVLARLAQAGSLILIEHAHPRYRIVVSPKATEPERFAADELNRYLNQMGAAQLPRESKKGPALHVGVRTDDIVRALDGRREDSFAVVTSGTDVYLTGIRHAPPSMPFTTCWRNSWAAGGCSQAMIPYRRRTSLPFPTSSILLRNRLSRIAALTSIPTFRSARFRASTGRQKTASTGYTYAPTALTIGKPSIAGTHSFPSFGSEACT